MHKHIRHRILFFIISILLAGVLLSACSDSGGGSSPTPPTPAEEPSVAELEEITEEAASDSDAEIDASADENERFGSAPRCGSVQGRLMGRTRFYTYYYGNSSASAAGITRSGTYTFSHRVDSAAVLSVRTSSSSRRAWSSRRGTLVTQNRVNPGDRISYYLRIPNNAPTNNNSLNVHGDCGSTQQPPSQPPSQDLGGGSWQDRLARLVFNLPASASIPPVTIGWGDRYNASLRFQTGLEAHAGIDYAVRDARVYSPISGQVIATDSRIGQLAIYDGSKTVHLLHLSRFYVTSGRVQKGQLVALSGDRGIGTGFHLHIEVRPGRRDSAVGHLSCGVTRAQREAGRFCTRSQVLSYTLSPQTLVP